MTEILHNTFKQSRQETWSYQEKSWSVTKVHSTASSPDSYTTENAFGGVQMKIYDSRFWIEQFNKRVLDAFPFLLKKWDK